MIEEMIPIDTTSDAWAWLVKMKGEYQRSLWSKPVAINSLIDGRKIGQIFIKEKE